MEFLGEAIITKQKKNLLTQYLKLEAFRFLMIIENLMECKDEGELESEYKPLEVIVTE